MEITLKKIQVNIDNPETLEDLYQSNKKIFSGIIKTLHEQESNIIIDYWYVRLFYKHPKRKHNTKKYLFTAFLIFLAWMPIWLMVERSFNGASQNNSYLVKAIPVVFSLALSLFFLFDFSRIKNVVLTILLHAALYLYMGLLPKKAGSQSLDNVLYFGFVLLWFFILLAHSNYDIKKLGYAAFLEKFGETIIWSTIFIIGGGIVVVFSVTLFNAINIDAGEFYLKNIVTLGLAAAPFVSLLVIENYNRIKLSVIVANIFLPLILITIIGFGIASLFTETKPYEDRDIFILYNVMMVIVLGVLVYTSTNDTNNKIINVCSCMLPAVTVILDIITISAVIYRLNKYGITANKITLLGTNIVMLGHLVYMIYSRLKHKPEQNVIYLSVYLLWAACVVFVFPFIFGMK